MNQTTTSGSIKYLKATIDVVEKKLQKLVDNEGMEALDTMADRAFVLQQDSDDDVDKFLHHITIMVLAKESLKLLEASE